MRRVALSIALGLILGTIAFFPIFVASAGHDSTSIFVDLARSNVLSWPFSAADFILPPSASRAVTDLGVAIHYVFYTLVGWLLSYLFRGGSRTAA